jgi:hypothetical protein
MRTLLFGLLLSLCTITVAISPAAPGEDTSVPFAVASVHLEQNATDGDAEVVFEVTGGDEGLANLTVVSPNGRTIIDFRAPDASTLGIREFRFETPEPKDVKSLQSAYPEGVYTFAGATAAGGKLHGKSTLNHKLPATASFLQPRAGTRDVSAKNLKITWTPVKNLAAYIIRIKQRKLGVNLEAKLPGTAATFAVPGSFLRPGTEYHLAIGTVSAEGNISFVEITFTTAGGE